MHRGREALNSSTPEKMAGPHHFLERLTNEWESLGQESSLQAGDVGKQVNSPSMVESSMSLLYYGIRPISRLVKEGVLINMGEDHPPNSSVSRKCSVAGGRSLWVRLLQHSWSRLKKAMELV